MAYASHIASRTTIMLDDESRAAADVFRSLGSPRRRANDIAIGVTAAAADAVLLTRNARDFAGIPELRVEAVA